MHPPKLLAIFIFVCSVSVWRETSAQTILKLMVLNATCCRANSKKTNIGQCLDFGVNPDQHSLHGTVNFTKDIRSFGQILVKVHRCQKTNVNSCKLAHTMRMINFCYKMQDKFAPWYPILQSFDPPISSCPIKKGVYVTSSGGIGDMRFTDFLALPLLDYPWYSKIMVFSEGNEPLSCLNIKIRFEHVLEKPLSGISE